MPDAARRAAKPRFRFFGLIKDWTPNLKSAVIATCADLSFGEATAIAAEPVDLGAACRLPIDLWSIFPPIGHPLDGRPDADARPGSGVARGAVPGSSERMDPENYLDSILAAILQPPLEELTSPNGVLEWPSALRPYQMDGVRHLLECRELLLADDMGLGKTIQALAALRILFHRREIGKVLIVAPASLTRQWLREAALWTPELKSVLIAGPVGSRAGLWRRPAHIVVVGYETLREDISLTAISPATETTWDVVVLDEASKIKNAGSGVARAAKQLPRTRRWALTGTPLETNVEDIRSILDFLFSEPNAPARIPTDVDAIKERLASCQVRRKKEEVLDELPPKTIHTIELDLGAQQRAAYDLAERQGIVQLRQRGAKVSITHVLELILRLKQLCNIDPESGESAKLDDIEERLETLSGEGHRALIFTQFTDETFGVEMVSRRLSKFAPLTYTGGMTAIQRVDVEEVFKRNPRHRVMALSLRAGSMGLNLKTASYVFHLDRWWNPAIEDQAESRAHRMGQQFPVHAYRYVCLNTIEERIEQILAERRALFVDVVDGSSLDLSAALSKGEIFGLFGLEPAGQPDKVDFGHGLMSGVEFERWVAELLVRQGFSVETTAQSRDGGIDLVASRIDLVGIASRLVIQCKNQSAPLSVQAVRELRGVVGDRTPGTTPVVACPAGFTRDAKSFATANGVALWGPDELAELATVGASPEG